MTAAPTSTAPAAGPAAIARDGRVLVDSAEAARLLGYANRESFTGIVRAAPPGRWPAPLAVPRPPNPAAENFGAVSAAAHAQDRADRAHAAGYPDWDTAIEATRTMTLSAAAARLGCTTSTVTFCRSRLGPARAPDPACDRARAIAAHIAASAQRRDDRARDAGYPDWDTAIEATRALSAIAAGARLGCNRSTIAEWRTRLDRTAGEPPTGPAPDDLT